MNKNFFQLSEFSQKLRRNFLFVTVLVFVHFRIEKLSELQVFNVKIPEKMVAFGLAISISWFGANYFFNLFAEFFEWKIRHIDFKGENNKELLKLTFLPELEERSDGNLNVCLVHRMEVANTAKELSEHVDWARGYWVKAAVELQRDIAKQFKSDLTRIDQFNNAFKMYKMANKAKFLLLDYFVPLMLLCLSIFYLI